jgi:DNA polymerase I
MPNSWTWLAALARKINELKELRGCTNLTDEPTVRSYIEALYERFPNVNEFFDQEWQKLKKLPAQDRVVHSLMGRERQFPRRATSEIERRFRVTWPQQIEADLMKTAMVRLDRIFRRRDMKARIVMMIHDALWVEAPKDEAVKVWCLVRRVMITAAKLKVPLKVDIE